MGIRVSVGKQGVVFDRPSCRKRVGYLFPWFMVCKGLFSEYEE